MPSPTTKLPVRLPPSWLAAIEQAAAAESVSPSEWIRAAIRRSLPADLRKTLESVRGRGRPKKHGREWRLPWIKMRELVGLS